MEEGDCGHRPLVLEIGIEMGELRRDHETLIDHSSSRHRDDVTVDILFPVASLGAHASEVERSVELGGRHTRRPLDKKLFNPGNTPAGRFTER